MDSLPARNSPPSSTDVFSLPDNVLANKLEFIEEVGFGNWGSVWLAQPKNAAGKDQVTQQQPQNKIAVKVVHRSKSKTSASPSTTAARVKSLWNEMKIVRTFKHDPHPSIIPFYSFIITPSHALITMAYLPSLVPVEVSEPKAREWFQSLLSAVKFLHDRGVVHNDIKPANILLSSKKVPVLVDFGFAERYDLSSDKAFHSNLSYGTPEYLSPERARGLPHDTRKSDVWSLGITFFEILVGRTPFEHSDDEQFTTKDELENYWSRTLKGKWVGDWAISPAVEKLLRRMTAPNADLRCNAGDAMLDAYWSTPLTSPSRTHRKSSSIGSSMVFEKDMDKLKHDIHKKGRPTTKGKENSASKLASPQGLPVRSTRTESNNALRATKSQPKINPAPTARIRRVPVPSIGDLSPIKGSMPSAVSMSPKAPTSIAPAASTRKAVKPRKPREANPPPTPPVGRPAHRRQQRPPAVHHAQDHVQYEPKPSLGRHISTTGALAATAQLKKERSLSRDFSRNSYVGGTGSQTARDRVKEWEREKDRLREMSRLEEFEKDRDEEIEEDNAMKERLKKANAARERASQSRATTQSPVSTQAVTTPKESSPELEPSIASEPRSHARDTSGFTATGWEQEREMIQQLEKRLQGVESKSGSKFFESCSVRSAIADDSEEENPRLDHVWAPSPPTAMRVVSTPELNMFGSGKLSGTGSQYHSIRHSIKRSIDKGISLYKTSVTKKRTSIRTSSLDFLDGAIDDYRTIARRESWEVEALQEANSSLPAARHNAKIAQDSRADRMSVWLRNVEQVVEDAKHNFDVTAPQDNLGKLPALPHPPMSRPTSPSRSNRSSRLPRKILAASEIFSDESFLMASGNQTFSSFVTSVHATTSAANQSNSDGRAQTRTSRSSGPAEIKEEVEPESCHGDNTSSSKEKSKSVGDLLQRRIAPLEELELELAKRDNGPPPITPPPLSSIDRSIYIATPPRIVIQDDLAASPLHIEPYPPRTVSNATVVPDTPQKRRVEGVYDRFLMATSGVKRVGKGYQSDQLPRHQPQQQQQHHHGKGIQNNHHQHNTIGHASGAQENIAPSPAGRDARKKYHTAKAVRRKMPPPVSSADLLRVVGSNNENDGGGVDELGTIMNPPPLALRDQTNGNGKKDGTLVRRALHAFAMPSKTVSRRMSRLA